MWRPKFISLEPICQLHTVVEVSAIPVFPREERATQTGAFPGAGRSASHSGEENQLIQGGKARPHIQRLPLTAAFTHVIGMDLSHLGSCEPQPTSFPYSL